MQSPVRKYLHFSLFHCMLPIAAGVDAGGVGQGLQTGDPILGGCDVGCGVNLVDTCTDSEFLQLCILCSINGEKE